MSVVVNQQPSCTKSRGDDAVLAVVCKKLGKMLKQSK